MLGYNKSPFVAFCPRRGSILQELCAHPDSRGKNVFFDPPFRRLVCALLPPQCLALTYRGRTMQVKPRLRALVGARLGPRRGPDRRPPANLG